jgi:hypothetical protein
MSCSKGKELKIMRSRVRLIVLTALPILVQTGCGASQGSVDELAARVTKLESKRRADKEGLTAAIDAAESERLDCRLMAENKFNQWLDNNGTPVKGKPGIYNASTEGLKQAHAEQNRADEARQREYEDAIQVAKLKYVE